MRTGETGTANPGDGGGLRKCDPISLGDSPGGGIGLPQLLFAAPIKQIGTIVALRLTFEVSSHCSKSFLPGSRGDARRRVLPSGVGFQGRQLVEPSAQVVRQDDGPPPSLSGDQVAGFDCLVDRGPASSRDGASFCDAKRQRMIHVSISPFGRNASGKPVRASRGRRRTQSDCIILRRDIYGVFEIGSLPDVRELLLVTHHPASYVVDILSVTSSAIQVSDSQSSKALAICFCRCLF
jgi:hypothetical protein